MMRSLFSGVAGLKTHQVRMDVIGNNIANVNTTAYKSQSMLFTDLLYQTTQSASGANANTGRGGVNPRQIGLGAKTGSISTAIATQGSAQSTNNPWDVMIDGDAFFIVNNGSQNFFTRDGSFTVDGAGNLVMSTTGYTVMGWQVDPETGEIRSDIVSALRIMHPDNLLAQPESTTLAYMNGILDKTDTEINSTAGVIRTLTFFDAQGYKYSALFSVHGIGSDDVFSVQLDDILDEDGTSLVKRYGLTSINQIANFGSESTLSSTSKYGMAQDVTYDYDETTGTGTFLVRQAMSAILDEYDSNALVKAAGSAVKIKSINGAAPIDGTEVKAGDVVVVGGNISLTRAQLESEPYNLIYNDSDGKYYKKVPIDPNDLTKGYKAESVGGHMPEEYDTTAQAAKTALDTAKTTLDNAKAALDAAEESGNGVEAAQTAYNNALTDYNTKLADYNTARDAARADADCIEKAQTDNNLEWMSALDLTGATVETGEGGAVTISFEATFNVRSDITKSVFSDNAFNTTIENTVENMDQIKELVYSLEEGDGKSYNINFIGPDGSAQITVTQTLRGNNLVFDHDTGIFSYIGTQGSDTAWLTFNSSASSLSGATIDLSQFSNIEIDFSSITNYGNGGKCTLEMTNGSKENSALGAGRKVGDLIGISVGQDGKITASYDNGLSKLLGQIAVASFANASGLSKVSNNLYSSTMNSGEFDGVGADITASGGSMTSGVLEMSNVDLSEEFTTMITTQRGFQANSRIISVSDSILEELVNLKR